MTAINRSRDESTPNPDPTVLTREALRDAMEHQDKILESKLETLRKVGDTRHKEIDEQLRVRLVQFTTLVDGHKAEDALQHTAEATLRAAGETRLSDQIKFHETRLNGIIEHVVFASVVDEKFAGVDKQFAERDTRVRDVAASGAAALSAALQAAKEAVGEANKSFSLSIDKSEKATGEQINQQRLLLVSTTEGIKSTTDDLKERLTRAEGELRAAATALGTAVAEKGERRGTNQWSAGMIVMIAMNALVMISTLLYFIIGKH